MHHAFFVSRSILPPHLQLMIIIIMIIIIIIKCRRTAGIRLCGDKHEISNSIINECKQNGTKGRIGIIDNRSCTSPKKS